MAVYVPLALSLEAVLKPIGNKRSVGLGLRSSLTNYRQYKYRVLWAKERAYNQLVVYGQYALCLERSYNQLAVYGP